jgi:hypothetical protein
MKRSPRPRRTVELPKSLHQRLNMYALAAGAAGVSAIALAPRADAKIIYTKTNTPIPVCKPYSLDLNHDGTTDFTISNCVNGMSSIGWAWVGVDTVYAPRTSQLNEVVWHSGFAADLPPNAPVWKNRTFGEYYPVMAACTLRQDRSSYRTTNRGPWRDAQSRYLGLKFSIAGQTHYGWARLNVKLNKKCNFVVTLTGYAYETIPNKLIFTGHTKGPDDIGVEEPDAALTIPTSEPATLGALALGAPGLSIWRRKELALQGE